MNQIALQAPAKSPILGSLFAFVRDPHKTEAAVREETRLRVIKARLRVAQQLATPGFMALRAVRERGEIVDFVWDSASAGAKRLMGRDSSFDLRGKRVSEVLAGHASRRELLDQYRQVVESGSAEPTMQTQVVNGANDIYRHGAVRLGDGVAVTLINISALKRARSLQLQYAAQQTADAAR
jgi:hypothetical protein